MKLRTNYSKNDWYRLIATYSLFALIAVPLILGALYYFLIPAIELSGMIAGFLNQDDIVPKFQEYLKQYFEKKLLNDDDRLHYLISTMLVFIGVMFGTIMVFVWFVVRAMLFPVWLAKKLRISPTMDLVVIKNGRFWFRMKA